MDDLRSLTALLEHRYGVDDLALRPLFRAEAPRIYQAETRGGARWTVRVGPLGAGRAGLLRDAATLTFLEQHGYPAPRVVRAADASTVTVWDERPILVTTFIQGEPTDFSPATLGRLGATLGRLHALPTPSPLHSPVQRPAALPPALMLPKPEIAAALSWLAEARERLPRRLWMRCDRLEAACRAIDACEDLPQVAVHNDCHPGNSVRTEDGAVVLIDWEGAGLGPAVIDIGFLLVSCEIEAFRSNRLPPDPERVAAVVDGYCRHHRLAAPELDRLANAIRFRSVVAAAGDFRRMAKGRLPESYPDWAWARHQAAEEIASRARERFERNAALHPA
jgi:Ser/Thr protein kinase RdoA (MazF antagonist)